jgi:hypothetical protein
MKNFSVLGLFLSPRSRDDKQITFGIWVTAVVRLNDLAVDVIGGN